MATLCTKLSHLNIEKNESFVNIAGKNQLKNRALKLQPIARTKQNMHIKAKLATSSFLICITMSAWTQSFTVLHAFTPLDYETSTNLDGATPQAGLTPDGDYLYGVTGSGGTGATGTIFQLKTDGTEFKVLHNFAPGPYTGTNTDGAYPIDPLIIVGTNLYGTTTESGPAGNGTIFRINTDGSGFTTLHSFTKPDGKEPNGLLCSSNILYGTTLYSGPNQYQNGTVYAMNTDGTGFKVLYAFTTNAIYPDNTLTLVGNTLFGVTSSSFGASGSIFKLNTDGTGYADLYDFQDGNDGTTPTGNLVVTNNTLYGCASFAIYAYNLTTSNFDQIYSLTEGLTDSGLIHSGNTIYGTTIESGTWGNGAIFQMNFNGKGFTNIYNFTGGFDGNTSGSALYKSAGLTLTNNTLYGTTPTGGNWGNGTIFKLSLTTSNPIRPILLAPQIIDDGLNCVITVSGTPGNYTLEKSIDLKNWITLTDFTIPASGSIMETNPTGSPQQTFFRVAQ
jgi:uncharacterized repeat protein (TIGR03803 family)